MKEFNEKYGLKLPEEYFYPIPEEYPMDNLTPGSKHNRLYTLGKYYTEEEVKA